MPGRAPIRHRPGVNASMEWNEKHDVYEEWVLEKYD
jgi:hypothetical protein